MCREWDWEGVFPFLGRILASREKATKTPGEKPSLILSEKTDQRTSPPAHVGGVFFKRAVKKNSFSSGC